MTSYAWTIVKDYRAATTTSSVVGTIGPKQSTYWRSERCASPSKGHEAILSDPDKRRYQLCNVDGEPLYEGFMVYNGDKSASGREPLIEVGLLECAKIRYRSNDGEWVWT